VLLPVLALLCLGALPARAAEPALNLWPLYDDRVDPVEQAHVQSALGPILEWSRGVDQPVESAAFRPLFYRLQDQRQMQDRTEVDILYPLFTYRRDERDSEFQLLQVFNGRREGPPDARERRLDLFPFYFSGRTAEGDSYWAVMPFGGRIRDRLSQDEISFVLFPLYARFVRGETATRYTPWPFVSVTDGPGRSAFRVAPFYGKDTQAGVFERDFVLWPFYLHQRTGLDTDNPEETHAVLPFYVQQRAPKRDSTTVLWPFFTYTDDRERGFTQWDAPWPLVQIARGERRRITRVLPFFSVEERVLRHEFLLTELRSRQQIVLFPVYIRTEDAVPGTVTVRDRILWWLYSDQRQTGRDGDTRRVDAWPFVLYTRDREGAVRFQALALIEALLPGNEWVERNYSPLWSLYTLRRSPEGAEVHSVLWNLLRHEETPTGRSIDVLGPLLRYREAEARSRLSLFGGLLEFDVTPAGQAVRLLGRPALAWGRTPQPIAANVPEGGIR